MGGSLHQSGLHPVVKLSEPIEMFFHSYSLFCGMVSSCRKGGGCLYPRIRDLREDHDLRQRELVAYLNCSQQVYSNYELGQRDIPTDVLIKLSSLYQVSVDYLLGITNNPQKL